MKEKNIFLKVPLLAFIPSLLGMLLYIFLGKIQNSIPSLLLFLICAGIVVFPFEIYIIYKNKANLSYNSKIKWWQLILIIGVLFGVAGLMTILITPLEHSLLSNVIEKVNNITPTYFSWDASNLANYSNIIITITCVLYFLLNDFLSFYKCFL